VHLAFDIFQGIGVAAAVGIRPFLPALATGALAAGDVEIHFNGTDYDFLQQTPFLLAMAVLAIAVAVAERRLDRDAVEQGPFAITAGLIALVVGALLFGGALARGHHPAWPGWIGGVACAAVAIAATWPLLARVRARVDSEAASYLPLFTEGSALALAVLSVVAPPIGVIGLAALVWLLIAGRARGEKKYAGLRILR
jgi:hypothetical protein